MRHECFDWAKHHRIDVQTFFDFAVDIHHIFPKKARKARLLEIVGSAMGKPPVRDDLEATSDVAEYPPEPYELDDEENITV